MSQPTAEKTRSSSSAVFSQKFRVQLLLFRDILSSFFTASYEYEKIYSTSVCITSVLFGSSQQRKFCAWLSHESEGYRGLSLPPKNKTYFR